MRDSIYELLFLEHCKFFVATRSGQKIKERRVFPSFSSARASTILHEWYFYLPEKEREEPEQRSEKLRFLTKSVFDVINLHSVQVISLRDDILLRKVKDGFKFTRSIAEIFIFILFFSPSDEQCSPLH